MDKYTNVARRKIAELIQQSDFKQILSITDNFVYIELETKSCRVDGFGKVDWINDELKPSKI